MRHSHNGMKSQPIALPTTADGHRLIVLVYQGGIANVFQVESFNLSDYGRDARRLYQGTFNAAESICYGLGLGGAIVKTACCNRAGDIQAATWSEDLDAAPFSEKFHPQFWNTRPL